MLTAAKKSVQIRATKSPVYNLGTYSNFSYDQEAIDILLNNFSKNHIDKHAYPDLSRMEAEMVSFLAGMTHASSDAVGVATTGSSEAIILAMAWHRKNALARRDYAGKMNFVVNCGYHKAFDKFAQLFDVELRAASLDETLAVDVERVAEMVDENTFCLVGVAGSTEIGMVDDIAALDEIAQKHDLPLHIDAAAGGYVLPFLADSKARAWDFACRSVQTMNISVHKYGLSMPGIGFLLARDADVVPQGYDGQMKYMSGGAMVDNALSCTRNGAFVAYAHHNMRKYGKSGYSQLSEENRQKAQYLYDELQSMQGARAIVGDLPVVTFSTQDANGLSSALRTKGWVQSAHRIGSLDEEFIRVVVRKDLTQPVLEKFVRDVRSRILDM